MTIQIDVLNQILWGEHMAIDIYDSYMNNIQDKELRKKLQKFQQDHKGHAMKLSAHIQDLGGTPQENRGLIGMMTRTMGKVNTFLKQNPEEILTELYSGEDKGLAKSVKLSENHLNEKSKAVLKEIFSDEHDHLKELKSLIEQYKH